MADGVQKKYSLFLGTSLEDPTTTAGVLYRGYAKVRLTPATDQPIWLISREYYVSGVKHVEHATFNHDQIWDDRASLFPAVVPDVVGTSLVFGLSEIPTITNITSPGIAGDEFTHVFGVGVKQFVIRPEFITRFTYSFVSAAEYVSVGRGGYIHRTRLNIQPAYVTIYLTCEDASMPFQIEEWT